MKQNNQSYKEEEIDLRELFKRIWDSRKFVLVFTLVVTVISVIYVFFKNPTPIYQGQALIEIGEIQSESFGSSLFDNPNNLSIILNSKFDIKSNIPKRTNNLIEISANSTDKDEINNKIKEVITYVIKRHKIKSKFYKNSIMTKEIGNININPKPINKLKKKLIVVVTFVTGFILSIFIVFFMQFISNMKEEK